MRVTRRAVTCPIGLDWRCGVFIAYDCPARCARRIRLVAYGARLESVLGASPRGFESPILRHRTPGPLQVPGFLLLVPRLISGRRESCPPASRPRRELRSARRLEARPGPAGLAAASNRAALIAVSGQALSAPVTPAALVMLCALARPRRSRGGLQSGGAYCCERPGLAAARGHCCQALGVPWRASIVRLLPCCAPASSPVKRA